MNEPGQNPYPPADVGEPQRASPVARRRASMPPVVTTTLLVLSVLMYLLQMLSTMVFGYDLPLLYGAKINEMILAGELWRFFTPMLLHGSLMHIAFNMYALYAIGSNVERFYGHGRFLVLYLVAGFAGNVFSFLFSSTPSVGASTAIFGLVAAEGVFILNNRFLFRDPRAALTNIAMVIVINLALGFSPRIDNWGHLGGLVGGAAMAWLGGPKLQVEGFIGQAQVRDTRGAARTWVAAGITFLVFAGLAATKFF